MCIESIPPNVEGSKGPPTGVLRVSLRAGGASKTPNSLPIVPTPGNDSRGDVFSLRWWNSSSKSTSIPLGGAVVYEIHSRRSRFVSFLADCPQRQALEISISPGARGATDGNVGDLSGFVPLASLIERLSTSDDANFRVADIPVLLKPRPDSPSSPLGAAAAHDDESRHIAVSVTVDVSFDEAMAGLADIDGKLSGLQLDAKVSGEAQTGRGGAVGVSPTHSGAHSRHTSLVLGRDSLDDVSSEPGWPRDARRMDVQVSYVCFDQAHAPLYINDNTTVHLTLATQQDGKDQQRTRSVGYQVKEKAGEATKIMRASWKNEVITFDPLTLDSGPTDGSGEADDASNGGDALRMSTDSHQSHQSHQSSRSSRLSPVSPTARSPILWVGLWKSVTIVDQFHSFSDGASPNDSLIGNAVVVVTGALGEEEGIEIPLYDKELKKSGVVHLKIGTSPSTLENTVEPSVDEQSQLNYDILSSLDGLKRHVLPLEDGPGSHRVSQRYAMSVSSDDSGACVGVAYEGAVSDEDEPVRHGNDATVRTSNGQTQEKGRIIDDDWIFNIEKSVG